MTKYDMPRDACDLGIDSDLSMNEVLAFDLPISEILTFDVP